MTELLNKKTIGNITIKHNLEMVDYNYIGELPLCEIDFFEIYIDDYKLAYLELKDKKLPISKHTINILKENGVLDKTLDFFKECIKDITVTIK